MYYSTLDILIFMKELSHGAIAVILTDTIYGIVTSAWNKESVEHIYQLKGRTPSKPCIILISSPADMKAFGVTDENIQKVSAYQNETPTSFIVPITRTDLTYLDRSTGTLAFRIPNDSRMQSILQKSGPLIAPSANTEGNPPATTINEARGYFGESVSYYEDGGTIIGAPSTLIDVTTGTKIR